MTSNNYDFIVKTLNSFISSRMVNVPQEIKNSAQEIRLRVNRPISISCPDETYYITSNGCVCNVPLEGKMFCLNRKEISEIFNNMCNYSIYAKQNEIKNGFITLKGGHRAGICGTAVFENNNISNIRDISSINIRIANEHKNCSKPILDRINNISGGLLVCGVPCSGKTTILRDLARLLSTSFSKKVALIDSRSEIAGTYKGTFQKDIGMSDVLDGYSKKEGFSHSLRCLSPDIIICDEIGDESDVCAIESALNSGVSVIASIHCGSKRELSQKKSIKKLISLGGFKNIVLLDNRKNAGKIIQIASSNDIVS